MSASERRAAGCPSAELIKPGRTLCGHVSWYVAHRPQTRVHDGDSVPVMFMFRLTDKMSNELIPLGCDAPQRGLVEGLSNDLLPVATPGARYVGDGRWRAAQHLTEPAHSADP